MLKTALRYGKQKFRFETKVLEGSRLHTSVSSNPIEMFLVKIIIKYLLLLVVLFGQHMLLVLVVSKLVEIVFL